MSGSDFKRYRGGLKMKEYPASSATPTSTTGTSSYVYINSPHSSLQSGASRPSIGAVLSIELRKVYDPSTGKPGDEAFLLDINADVDEKFNGIALVGNGKFCGWVRWWDRNIFLDRLYKDVRFAAKIKSLEPYDVGRERRYTGEFDFEVLPAAPAAHDAVSSPKAIQDSKPKATSATKQPPLPASASPSHSPASRIPLPPHISTGSNPPKPKPQLYTGSNSMAATHIPAPKRHISSSSAARQSTSATRLYTPGSRTPSPTPEELARMQKRMRLPARSEGLIKPHDKTTVPTSTGLLTASSSSVLLPSKTSHRLPPAPRRPSARPVEAAKPAGGSKMVIAGRDGGPSAAKLQEPDQGNEPDQRPKAVAKTQVGGDPEAPHEPLVTVHQTKSGTIEIDARNLPKGGEFNICHLVPPSMHMRMESYI